ncbi:hypothetical protein N7532_000514 [Penicillium argentinense]|uniref:Cytochrome b-c1 complex subunit 10 n=1 Tax=Penicillium argentinense TaxID=1131581 RepID=A0A9W9KMQ0_9EURO|nr:uncharacterized protein N7532_000514 [Penicillium argentinense]KAJ5112469.1 hypothetical protein N7532_000514 [Penicillium argentinense]
MVCLHLPRYPEKFRRGIRVLWTWLSSASDQNGAFAPTLRRAAAAAPSSAFASNFATQRAVAGFTLPNAIRAYVYPQSFKDKGLFSTERMLTLDHSGTLAGSFGVFAGAAALFFLGEVPRVRRDILQQFPFLDTYFDRPIAPEDNPF